MDLRQQIDKDLKSALLAGDKTKVETLKGLKNALQYETVGSKEGGELDEAAVQKVLAREAKKRQEAVDLYKQGGNHERAEAELAEKEIIEAYLPAQLDDTAIDKAVKEEIAKVPNASPQDMGRIIGSVKGRLGTAADGATVARLVKENLNNQ